MFSVESMESIIYFILGWKQSFVWKQNFPQKSQPIFNLEPFNRAYKHSHVLTKFPNQYA